MYSDNEYEYSDGGSDDDEENKAQEHAHDTSFSSALSEMSGVGKSPGGPTAANSSRDSHSSNIADGEYRFMDAEEIIPVFTSLLSEVTSLMGLDTPQAEILLRYMKWDKENLINDFFEDAEKLQEKCGLKYYTPELAHRIESMVISQNADGETQTYMGNKPDDGRQDSEGTYLAEFVRRAA